MWLYIIQGIGYGFAAAVQPGPFQTYIISQALKQGWKRTLIAALAPLVSDGPIIALCLLVLSQVPVWFQRALYVLGGSFVLYLAYGAYQAWKKFDSNIPTVESTSQQSILQAAFVNLLSPGPYIFWSLVTGPILLQGWREAPMNGIGFLAGFYSILVAGLGVIVILFGAARDLGPKVNRGLLGISAMVLFCFGVYQLWQGVFYIFP